MTTRNVIARAYNDGRERFEMSDLRFTIIVGLTSGKEVEGFIRTTFDDSNETFIISPLDEHRGPTPDVLFIRMDSVVYAKAKRYS